MWHVASDGVGYSLGSWNMRTLVVGGYSYRACTCMVDKRGGVGQGLKGMMGEAMGKVSKALDARKGEGMTADVERRQVVVKKGEGWWADMQDVG